MKDQELEFMSKMNVIRIVRDDGIERALRLYPELKDFIASINGIDFKAAKDMVLKNKQH